MASCAVEGGCPSDFIAIAFSLLCTILFYSASLLNFTKCVLVLLGWLVSRLIIPCVLHKIPNLKGSGFWIPVIQVFASLNLLMSIVMSVNFLKFERRHGWQSCYVWAVWIEGPFGFGLLLSCRIAQAFKLFFVFVKRRLPAIRSYFFLPIILLPWIAGAAFIHVKKPLNHRCHMGAQWIIPILSLHSIYVATLVGFTMAIRHIEFRFDELRDLWKGILVSASSIGIWVSAYILNEIHEEVPDLQVVSRFLLLVSASILVLVFYSISSSEPLLSQVSLRRNLSLEQETMGKALGIPDNELSLQNQSELLLDRNEPLDKILMNTKFRQTFMAFADSCLAGESVHFYDEVDELGKLPVDDTVRRIYMARHIIDKYITAGAPMEVNISHRSRLAIMKTSNLADPKLFDVALNELLHLMQTNLAKDFWSSMFYAKLKEETGKKPNGYELEQLNGWNLSPRPSSVQGKDDPFNQDSSNKEQLLL